MLVNSGVGDTRGGLGETGALFGIAQPTMINTNHSERWKWGNGRTDDKIKRPIASGKKEESMWVSNIIFQHTTAEEKKTIGWKKESCLCTNIWFSYGESVPPDPAFLRCVPRFGATIQCVMMMRRCEKA